MRNLSRLLNYVVFPVAFENEAGWKMDGDHLVLQDGNPVWIDTNGAESVLKRDTVSRLNGEAKDWRTKYETASGTLKTFEGLDPAAAREALDKLKLIDQKKLIDAGEVETVRNTIKTEYEKQIQERDNANGALQNRINGMILDAAFTSSKYISENVAIPNDVFRAAFGKHFEVKDDKIVSKDAAGNALTSKKNIGEPASFEEAIEMILEAYPHKDSILKAQEHRGSGSGHGGQHRGGQRTMKRADFDRLDERQKPAFMALVRKGEAQLVD